MTLMHCSLWVHYDTPYVIAGLYQMREECVMTMVYCTFWVHYDSPYVVAGFQFCGGARIVLLLSGWIVTAPVDHTVSEDFISVG